MTGSTPTGTPWYVRPAVVLPMVAVLVVASVLLTPAPAEDSNAQLTSYSSDPRGAQLLYELGERLGWEVERSRSGNFETRPDIIHAVLSPIIPLRMSEVHEILEHVRAGGGLLVVATQGAQLFADSLGLSRTPGGALDSVGASSRTCATQRIGFLADAWQLSLRPWAFTWEGEPPARVDTLRRVAARRQGDAGQVHPLVLAMPLGQGRVVVLSDADLLRNDAMRICRYGLDIAAVRALEYLREGGSVPRRRVVFDEYHQGHGVRPGSMVAILRAFGRTGAGQLFYQLAGAGVLLLFALAPRAVPPRDTDRVQRRSPLEHVDALARAYQQVGATRTATSRMVRGVRRRTERGAVGTRTAEADERFLQRVADSHPERAGDVTTVRTALQRPVDRAAFTDVAAALSRIEHTLNRI